MAYPSKKQSPAIHLALTFVPLCRPNRRVGYENRQSCSTGRVAALKYGLSGFLVTHHVIFTKPKARIKVR